VRATTPVSMPPKVSTTRDDEAEATGESGASFAAHGVDRREIRKLKRGEYLPADRYDLHGLTANAAAAAVKRFLETSRRNGHRCVCIVHVPRSSVTGRRRCAQDFGTSAPSIADRRSRVRRRAAIRRRIGSRVSAAAPARPEPCAAVERSYGPRR